MWGCHSGPMEVEEIEETPELASVSYSLLVGLALRGVLRAVGLCGKGQSLDALQGLPAELKVTRGCLLSLLILTL